MANTPQFTMRLDPAVRSELEAIAARGLGGLGVAAAMGESAEERRRRELIADIKRTIEKIQRDIASR
jgi:hypothetical protein